MPGQKVFPCGHCASFATKTTRCLTASVFATVTSTTPWPPRTAAAFHAALSGSPCGAAVPLASPVWPGLPARRRDLQARGTPDAAPRGPAAAHGQGASYVARAVRGVLRCAGVLQQPRASSGVRPNGWSRSSSTKGEGGALATERHTRFHEPPTTGQRCAQRATGRGNSRHFLGCVPSVFASMHPCLTWTGCEVGAADATHCELDTGCPV
ncbi:hypothetical protein ERJ75_001570800 [Trypanosoma vivax]|nr:hypothetical protein ERJ75_001570800 [Trypanosoma vivax]